MMAYFLLVEGIITCHYSDSQNWNHNNIHRAVLIDAQAVISYMLATIRL